MDVADWLCQPSPQRLNDGFCEELDGVDQWLKDGLPDIGEDDVVGSLADFTGREFFNESSPPNGASDSLLAPLQQQSTSSDPTSSGEGLTSSGAVCGGSGLGHFTRGGAMRSFSANDLQLLLENPLGMFPPMAGLSAPYGSHMGRGSLKGRPQGPALEPVPEGAPSQGGPLPSTPPLTVPPNLLPGGGGLDSGATSPALGTSPGAAPFLPQPAAAATPGLAPGVAMTAASADGPPVSAAALAPQQPLTGGGLRTVLSSGSLSTLVYNMLHIPREGSDESPQQPHQLKREQSLPHHQHQQQHSPQQQPQQPQQQLLCDAMGRVMAPGQVLSGSPAPPIGIQQPQQQQQQLVAPGCAAMADGVGAVGFDASAMATVAAAAANAFPFSVASAPTAVPQGLPQACLYGIPPYLGSSSAFPIGAYSLGLPLPMSAHALPAQQSSAAVMPATTSDGAMVQPPAAVCGGVAAASTGGGAPAAPRLRKSQSALELGAWRTSSLGSEGEGLEPDATIAAVGQKMIGRLTPEERLLKILRYRNKRNQRNFNREIKYHCRKTLADSRPRVGGRFARNNDPNSVMPHQTKKAMRMKMVTRPEDSQQRPLRVRGAGLEAGDVARVVVGAAAGDRLAQQGHQQQHAAAVAVQNGQLSHGFFGGSLVSAPASCSSTTTNSSNSAGDHSAAATSAGTAAVASAPGGGGGLSYSPNPALPLPRTAVMSDGASGAAMADGTCVAGGLSYTYGITSTMPYAAHSHMPGAVMLPHLGGVPVPEALPAAAMDAAQMHHHYAMVTAAAQAAARGVFAHLSLSTAAPNVSAVAAPGAVHMQTNLLPQPNGLAGYAVAAAGEAAAATANGGSVGALGMGGSGAAAALPNLSAPPLLGAQFADMDRETAAAAAAQSLDSGVGGSCMAVDG